MLLSNGSTIYEIANFTIGSGAISYKVDKYTSSTDNLTVKIGSTTIATRSNVTGTDTGSFTKTITFSSAELTKIYNAMPKVTKATFTFTINSIMDGESIGATSATATGTLPDSLKPTLTSVSLVEATTGLASKFAAFIKNKTKLTYSYKTTLATGTTLSTYNLVIDGNTYTKSTGTTNIIKNSGTLSYSAYVTDSRGRKSNVLTGTISVLDYVTPQITAFKVIRCDSKGIEDNGGAYAKYTINASISPINNKNDKSFVIDYQKQGDSSWTTWKTYTGGYTLNETSAVLSISEDDAYYFRVTIKDYFTSAEPITKRQSLSSAFTIMDIKEDGTGLAFGKVADESNVLDIGFKETFISNDTYMGGKERSDAEKNVFFTNTGSGTNKHNVKMYGGNSESTTALGLWDVDKDLPIFQYFDGDEYRLKFGEDIVLKWGSYDIESVLAKVFSSATGRYRTKTGLLLQWGSVSITPVANTPTSANITFPIAYDSTPNIQVSAVSGVPWTNVLGFSHGNDSASGTTLYVTRTNTTATVLRWFAIGIKEV